MPAVPIVPKVSQWRASAADTKPTTITTVVNKKRITARGYAYVIEIRDTPPSSFGGHCRQSMYDEVLLMADPTAYWSPSITTVRPTRTFGANLSSRSGPLGT